MFLVGNRDQWHDGVDRQCYQFLNKYQWQDGVDRANDIMF